MLFTKIHHVAIIVSNYEISKKFYVDVLGFKVLKETYREDRDSYKLDLIIGNDYQIELFSFPNPPERVDSPEATGLRHLAFEVNSIEKTIEYLNSQNVVTEPIRVDNITGKRFTFFKDPDSLPLEIYEK